MRACEGVRVSGLGFRLLWDFSPFQVWRLRPQTFCGVGPRGSCRWIWGSSHALRARLSGVLFVADSRCTRRRGLVRN